MQYGNTKSVVNIDHAIGEEEQWKTLKIDRKFSLQTERPTVIQNYKRKIV